MAERGERARSGAAAQAPSLLSQAAAHLQAGRLQEAEQAARLVLMGRPGDADASNLLGLIALQRGEHAAAAAAFTRALAAQPRNPGLHCNLGSVYLRSGEFEAAAEAFAKAARLQTDFADAFALKGDALRMLGRWSEASAAYQKALRLNKAHIIALNGLGLCLAHQGDASRAAEMFSAALAGLPPRDKAGRARILAQLGSVKLRSGTTREGLAALIEAASLLPDDADIAVRLAKSLRHVTAVPADPKFRDVLLRLLARDDVNPRAVSGAAALVLKSNPSFAALLQRIREAGTSESGLDEQSVSALAGDALLIRLLACSPIPDGDVEIVMIALRRHLLLSATQDRSNPLQPRLALLSALAQQCYLNEYVYDVSTEEEEAVDRLIEGVTTAQPDWARLAVIACYRPLSTFVADGLPRAEAPSCLDAVFIQEIDEPEQERAFASGLKTLTDVSDAVSMAVRDQYEDSPYPRWTSCFRGEPRPFGAAIGDVIPHLDESKRPHTDSPRILIAGCGTGLETMRVASSYQAASILAVDLSRASLGYGMRKLAENGVVGVEHGQADILELGEIEDRFDLIHSVGVIHHMSEPQRGLHVLAGLLAPGGYLHLGLYSAAARKAVTRMRGIIAARGTAPTPAGIRKLRREIVQQADDPDFATLVNPASDFWTLSECRDLLFHVEEHQFTLLQIEDMLIDAGLEFLGLEIAYGPYLTLFRSEHPDPAELTSLRAWHRFEEQHLEAFGGMYRLWARKPGSISL